MKSYPTHTHTNADERSMEKYEQLSVVGEGSYGVVMKCRHRDTDQLVAIKKFLETEEDATVRRMALREIRMLKRLRHENLVTMIEVFRHRKRFYLVFEYMEGTVLDELEKYPEGLGNERTRERIYQVTRAVQYCHVNHIIHRDVKPENVLVSSRGVVKLCDFGFARLVGGQGDAYTEYVATRWYRAPELLVGETHYGAPVDIWAIGCLFSEMMTGEPLFPGESDIDQLYLIVKLIGKPCSRHQQLMAKNTHLRSIKRTSAAAASLDTHNLYKLFPTWSLLAIDFLSACMKMDPVYRPTADDLLKHNYFLYDRFPDKFLPALRDKVRAEFTENPLLRKFKMDMVTQPPPPPQASRRTMPVDGPRWRISLVHESVKRKFSSSDTVASDHQHPTSSDTRTLIRTGPKLATMHKPGPYNYAKSTLLKRDENNKLTTGQGYIVPKVYQQQQQQEATTKHGGSTKENPPRLALDLLAKLNQKNSLHHYRPKSSNKDCGQQPYNTSASQGPASPPEFQSLQSSQSFREPVVNKSPILHPTITNISFAKEAKKSPYLLGQHHHQQQQQQSVKNGPSPCTLAHVPKTHHLKRLDRCVVVDTAPLIVEKTTRFKSPPDWLNSVGMAHMKRDSWKGKAGDEFTLPIVPGATGSPYKSKKKQTPDLHFESRVQTPRIPSTNSQKSTSSQRKHLPFM